MAEKKKSIAIIGAGIIGLSTAIYVQENFTQEINLTIISEKFSPETTGDGSAGFWMPYACGEEIGVEQMKFWCEETYRYLLDIWKSSIASEVGVGLLSAYLFTEEAADIEMIENVLKPMLLHCHRLGEDELTGFQTENKSGYFLTTFYTECRKFLPFLMRKFTQNGGEFKRRKILGFNSLSDEFDLIINCTGLGAKQLTNDDRLLAMRGQVLRINAPFIKHAIVDDHYYILPNSDCVVIGGTKQLNNWSTAIDEHDRQDILSGCSKLLNGVELSSLVVEDWVGLRPYRDQPRIESETINLNNGKHFTVIHNYGHGGSGVTLFWGCAKQVCQLVKDALLKL